MLNAVTQTHPPERRLRIAMSLKRLHGLGDEDSSVVVEVDEGSSSRLSSE